MSQVKIHNFKVLTFPSANKLLSNKSNIPKNRKNIPNPASPTPISTIKKHYFNGSLVHFILLLLWVSVISNIFIPQIIT